MSPTDQPQPGNGAGAKKPPVRILPMESLAPKRSIGMRLFLVALLGVGAYGGYYGYCGYKCGEKEHAIFEASQDLHNWLMRQGGGGPVSAEQVKQFVIELAARVGVEVKPGEIQASFEPLNDESMKRLPPTAQMGIGLAAQATRAKPDLQVVGYHARFLVSYGMVKRTFESERYTYLQGAGQ